MGIAPAPLDIERPLRLGEVLAAAVRIYGRRAWAFLGLGVLQAVALVASAGLPFVLDLVVLSLAFVAAFAATIRLVVGDPFGSALRRTAGAVPELLVLAFVVAVPFYLGSGFLILLILSVAWLGLTAFAIPAVMVEEVREPSWLGRAAYGLRRTMTLARAEYLHAVGVAATLVVIYILLGVVLALALFSFADNGQLVALALAQIVLAPFFFIGLSVLYFDQRARALEAVGKPGQ